MAQATTSDVINPATEEVLRTVEHTDEAGVDDAVARAKAAQKKKCQICAGSCHAQS